VNAPGGPLRRVVTLAVTLSCCLVLGLLVARPGIGDDEAGRLATRYGFSVEPLSSPPPGGRTVRQVNPGAAKLAGWLSATGAAVALADLRGLGRPADVCLVDPRDDSVSLRPALPSDTAYRPVVLSTAGLRYDRTMAPMGCVPADLDEDGDTDLLVYHYGRTPVLYLNTGGTAVPTRAAFRPVELVNPPQVWNASAMGVGDIDGDGHLDLMVGTYFADGARMLDPDAKDGVQLQDGMGLARNSGLNRLFLTRPTGRKDTAPTLVDASAAIPEKVRRGWTFAFGLQDLTGDLLPEVYQANDFGPDVLLVNRSTPGKVVLQPVRGNRDLTTPKSQTMGRDSFKGMGVTFTYATGTGLPTIVVSNITAPYGLQESNFAFVPTGPGTDLLRGEVPFRDDSERLGLSRSGWSWDVKAGDFDNDGVDEIVQTSGFLQGTKQRWPLLQELAMGNDELVRHPSLWPAFRPGDDLSGDDPDKFWVPGPDGRYTDLAARLGLATPMVSRGLAFGDVDGDGKLDAAVANQWKDAVLLHNTGPGGRPAARIAFVRPGAAGGVRPAIGVQVELRDPVRPQKTQLYPANGHAGVSAADVSLALGAATVPATVTWVDEQGLHRTTITVRPGRSTVELRTDGTAVTR
jgi:enediyne biosynthesis protein E4